MELLLPMLFKLLIVSFTIYLYTRYFKKIELLERKGWIRFPFWILLLTFHILICFLDTVYPILNIVVNSVLFVGILATNYKLKFTQYLYHFIFYYVLWILSDVSSAILISTTAGLDFESVSIESGILSCLIMCLLTPFIIERRKNKKKTKKAKSTPNVSSLIPAPIKFLFIPAGCIYINIYIFLTSTDYTSSFTFFLFTLFVFIFNYISYDTYETGSLHPGSDNIHPSRLIEPEIYHLYATEYESAYLENKKRRNRLNQYLADVKRDFELGNISDAESKINTIIKENTLYKGDISKSGNIVIDSVINNKYGLLEKYGIKIDCNVLVPETLPFNHADLNNILNILLNNAICTCYKLPEDKKKLNISVSLMKGNLYIKLIYHRPVSDSNKSNHTNRHLLSLTGNNIREGLSLVQNIANKYHGNFEIYDTEKVSKVSVVLPICKTVPES